MSFKDKVVLVTGASSGIGAAIALKFAEESAKVVIVGRNEKRLNTISEKIEKSGSAPLVIAANVTKDADAERIIKETIKHFGKIDVLINNAGIAASAAITEDWAMEAFDQVMTINLRSVVYMTHLASKHIVETKGNIINISSIAALVIPNDKVFPYATSKAALDHFTRAVASELASKGVRVNSINPGPVKTDIIENMGVSSEQELQYWEFWKNKTALKRISDSSEVADIALFLASDKAVGITGSSFIIDNGCLVSTNINTTTLLP